jgi:hypothetical protein
MYAFDFVRSFGCVHTPDVSRNFAPKYSNVAPLGHGLPGAWQASSNVN